MLFYTDGNLFNVKEMLQRLQDSDLLTFDAAQFGASCSWDDDEDYWVQKSQGYFT